MDNPEPQPRGFGTTLGAYSGLLFLGCLCVNAFSLEVTGLRKAFKRLAIWAPRAGVDSDRDKRDNTVNASG